MTADATDIAPATGKLRLRVDRCTVVLFTALTLQSASTVFFVGALWGEVLGLRTHPVPWEYMETIEIGASVALLIGLCFTVAFLRQSLKRSRDMRRRIDAVSGGYQAQVDAMFARWGLSKSEQAVAICAMKGFSNAEIADFRRTSVATVKSQMNAVYRKGGIANRQQLIAVLVEEFLTDVRMETS